MKNEAFEAFCAAMDGKSDKTQVRRATAFWSRLGDVCPEDVALEDVSIAQTLNHNPAGCCMAHAAENYSPEEIIDAALYAARS